MRAPRRAILETLSAHPFVVGHALEQHARWNPLLDVMWRESHGRAVIYGEPKFVLPIRGVAK